MLEHFAAGRGRALRRWALVVCAGAAALALEPAQALARYASFIIDANTGRELYARNADSQRYPASLTKMMTLYMLFEQIEAGRVGLEDRMAVSAHAAMKAPTKLGLRPGQTLRVRDAILGLITKSANDAAAVIAEHLGGSEEEFARMMTRKARSLGMSRSTFQNASGLPDSEQVTTARDMAILGIALAEHFPTHYRFFSTRGFAFNGRVHANHNKLLGRVPGVDGIKTGYTHASGFNLVSSVRRDGRHVVAVVLGGPTARARDAHMRDLLAKHVSAASSHRAVASLVARPGRSPTGASAVAQAEAAKPVEKLVATPAAALSPQALPAPQPKPVTEIVKPAVQSSSTVAEAFAALGYAQNGTPSAARPAPQDDTAEPARPTGREGWAIQIGAVESEEAARELLNGAKADAGRALKGTDPVTEKVSKGGQTLYRARFAGFEAKEEAQAACAVLKRKDYACFAVGN